MSSTRVRVLMIWRHRLLTEAVAAALDRRARTEIVAVVGAVREAKRVLATEEVDVALLDVTQGLGTRLELAFRLTEEFPRLCLLPFGVRSDDEAVALVEAGSAGFLSRDASIEEVVQAVVELHDGGAPVPLAFAARVAARIEELERRVDRSPRSDEMTDHLSGREREVLVTLARGLGNKEIAHRLGIRTATVKNHVHSILTKLGVGRRREAVRRAYKTGLLRGPLRWARLDRDD